MMKLFRYSGNKTRYLQYYKMPSQGYKRIVEPYFGSGSFSLNNTGSAVGYEVNDDLYAMLAWLKTTDKTELFDLKKIVDINSSKNEKLDVRTLQLEKGPETYLRINVCSAVVGQLSSWKIYPQHKLPVEKTLESIPRLKEIILFNKSGESHIEDDGDLVFIDPPYIDTKANYFSQSKDYTDLYNPNTTIDFIKNTKSPIIFTYGTNAKKIFPNYNWNLVKEVKVPNIRNGGTVSRYEYVSYINF